MKPEGARPGEHALPETADDVTRAAVPPRRRAPLLALGWLRAPRLIVAELVGIALSGGVSTVIPQRTDVPEDWTRFAGDSPMLARVARALALDHVVGSGWFLALVLLAAGSLGVVLVDQWRRLLGGLRRTPGLETFANAPYRVEWVRPARHQGVVLDIRSSGRVSDFGSPVFHSGLLTIVLAGVLHLLFAARAVADLVEGDSLAGAVAERSGAWQGVLARPIATRPDATFVRLSPERYASGGLRQLSAEVAVEGKREPVTLAINEPLEVGENRVYVSARQGPAAYLDLALGGEVRHVIVLLHPAGDGVFQKAEAVAPGMELRLRALVAAGEVQPADLEVRVLRQNGVVFAGRVPVGARAALPGGSIGVPAIRNWARFTVSRDPSWLAAMLGFALSVVGAILMYGVVRVDRLVWIRPEGDGERVVVAMRPRRFVPVFRETFDGVVARERARGG